MNVLITGVAGFIGYHAARRLAAGGHHIIGLDNLNSYYDPRLKYMRLEKLKETENFEFNKVDLEDEHAVFKLFEKDGLDAVLHLGAQAGVRYSIENPQAYIKSNVTGTLNILEGCRQNHVSRLVYASSSSVYGANTKVPFATEDFTDSPISLYAATKKSNELMCRTYAHLYGIISVGLRFFTVYGPWGRPDMAYFKFANAISQGRPIDIYNFGKMSRDFTYIDDIVDGIVSAIDFTDSEPFKRNTCPHAVFNLGNNKPEELGQMISYLEQAMGATAEKNFLPMQLGDVQSTYADITGSQTALGFLPTTDLKTGIEAFVLWYKTEYKNIQQF